MNGYWTNEMISVAKGEKPHNQEFFDESKTTVLSETEKRINRMQIEMQNAQKLLDEYPIKIKELQQAKEIALKTNNLLPLAKLQGFLRNVTDDLGELTKI